MIRRIQTLERQIDRIKAELVALGDLRPGTLSKQYNVCGKPNCRCKASPPKRHGPYDQLSFTRKGRNSTRFVRREQQTIVSRQVRTYARLKKLVDRWIDLAEELSNLRLSQRKG